MQPETEKKMLIRLPKELSEWLSHQSRLNLSSMNSEVVRAIRQQMEFDRARQASNAS